MTGKLRLDGAGLASLASTVTASASDSAGAGRLADAALTELAAAAPGGADLAAALSSFAGRFRGQTGALAQYLSELGTALARVEDALGEADAGIAGAATRMRAQ
ncbi:MAG TPA: hypothetical protein VGC45_00755 [Gryllotalpicola sp.]